MGHFANYGIDQVRSKIKKPSSARISEKSRAERITRCIVGKRERPDNPGLSSSHIDLGLNTPFLDCSKQRCVITLSLIRIGLGE